MPKIIDFLGYVPFECPDEPIGKLRYFKLVNGLSYERLGKLVGRDPEQLTDWLSGRIKPCKRNIEVIQEFLNSFLLGGQKESVRKLGFLSLRRWSGRFSYD